MCRGCGKMNLFQTVCRCTVHKIEKDTVTDKQGHTVNINSFSFSSMCLVIVEKLTTGCSQNNVIIQYKMATCSDHWQQQMTCMEARYRQNTNCMYNINQEIVSLKMERYASWITEMCLDYQNNGIMQGFPLKLDCGHMLNEFPNIPLNHM